MLIQEKTLKAINTENFKLIGQILQEIFFFAKFESRNTKFKFVHSTYGANTFEGV